MAEGTSIDKDKSYIELSLPSGSSSVGEEDVKVDIAYSFILEAN